MEENEIEFDQETVEDEFYTFSIDEGLEQKFNAIQSFVEEAKIHYHAYVQARKIQCQDQS